jgi:hypothetical protein
MTKKTPDGLVIYANIIIVKSTKARRGTKKTNHTILLAGGVDDDCRNRRCHRVCGESGII